MSQILTIVLFAALKGLFLILLFVLPLAAILTWMERRQSALMQDRLGPNRANLGRFRAWGLLHVAADGLKMFFKEDFVPARAHKALFALAPILALAPAFIVFGVIPFSDGLCGGSLLKPVGDTATCEPMQVVRLDTGLLFYFAIATLSVYGATLAGWASYNKWSLLGALRAASQMLSYEVTMGMALVGVFLVYGTLEPGAIVRAQGANVLKWGVVLQPAAFILFGIAAVAETKRAPFDLPEGESEIVGYFVEYSGMRFGMFYFAEFIEVVFASALLTTAFFGGWQIPFVSTEQLAAWGVPNLVAVLLQFVMWSIKVVFFCFLQLSIRWALPRVRPDQLMKLGWTRLLPASVANIIITAGVLTAMRKH
jgi:NADH-quinone oxidoreductase subunit H